MREGRGLYRQNEVQCRHMGGFRMGYAIPRALALRAPIEKPKHTSLLTTSLLTIEEARAALRVSKWTVYRLVNDRQLETLKIGSRRLIPAHTVEQYIARKLAEGTA